MALSSPVYLYVFRSIKLALKAYVKTHCTLPTSNRFAGLERPKRSLPLTSLV